MDEYIKEKPGNENRKNLSLNDNLNVDLSPHSQKHSLDTAQYHSFIKENKISDNSFQYEKKVFNYEIPKDNQFLSNNIKVSEICNKEISETDILIAQSDKFAFIFLIFLILIFLFFGLSIIMNCIILSYFHFILNICPIIILKLIVIVFIVITQICVVHAIKTINKKMNIIMIILNISLFVIMLGFNIGLIIYLSNSSDYNRIKGQISIQELYPHFIAVIIFEMIGLILLMIILLIQFSTILIMNNPNVINSSTKKDRQSTNNLMENQINLDFDPYKDYLG